MVNQYVTRHARRPTRTPFCCAAESVDGDCWSRLRLNRVLDERAALTLAQHLRDRLGYGDEPLDELEHLCDARRVDVEDKRLRAAEGGLQGLLVPKDDGRRFHLIVDDDVPGGGANLAADLRAAVKRHRRRFIVAHELAHSFFYAQHEGRVRRAVPDGPEQEAFCDAFARGLLVPPRVVQGLPPTPETVVELQHRFDVSMQVAARAVDAVHGERVFVALLLASASADGDAWRPQWRPEGPTPRRRWWAGRAVQEASDAGRSQRDVGWAGGRRTVARARLVAHRRQLVFVAERPASR